jgi:hypothetical protein
LTFVILMASVPILGVRALPLPESDARKRVNALNLSDIAVLDAQTPELPTSKFKMLFVDGSWFSANKENATLIQQMRDTVLIHTSVITVGGDDSLIYSMADSPVKQSVNGATQVRAVYFDVPKIAF